MSNLIRLEETFFTKTRETLVLLDEDPTRARTAIQELFMLEDREMQLVISRAALEQGLCFDIEEKTKHIKTLLSEALQALDTNNKKQAKKSLEKVLKIQKELLAKQRERRNEKILARKIAVDAAIAMLLRLIIDPYIQAFGTKLDVLQYKVENFDKVLKQQAKESYQETRQTVKSKFKKWFGLEKEEPAVESPKQQVIDYNKLAYSKYTNLIEHPKYIPHFSLQEPFSHLLSDTLYLAILAVLVKRIGFKHVKNYFRKKAQENLIKKIAQQLFNIHQVQIKSLQDQAMASIGKAKQLEGKVTALEQQLDDQPSLAEIERQKELLKREIHHLVEQARTHLEAEAKKLAEGLARTAQTMTKEE
ncbi:MAG: hypothetical protein WC595_03615 [Candidatus Nanoarchaeia archaeon]